MTLPNDIAVSPDSLADEATALVTRWLKESASIPVDTSGQRLAGVLSDPNGLDFTVGFVDGVVRPEDRKIAGRNLKQLVPLTPSFLPGVMKQAIKLGGAFATSMPGIVVPTAQAVLRSMVSHLIVDASDQKLGPALAKIKQSGAKLNINLLGEAVLGAAEADKRLVGTEKLLRRPDVEYVSIKVSSTVAPHSPWAYEENVAHVIGKLRPLYEIAAQASPRKFINLDMEEFKDLDITIDVFTRILDDPAFLDLEAGIVLQAYLPDALPALERLTAWAQRRVDAGGAPIKVRVVKGANLPMERVEAGLHGWPLATWGSKQDSDTHYKRVLDFALRPENARAVRIGVAGHNLFDVALAWLLAKARGVQSRIEFEMLLGMATNQAEVVKREVGGLLLYTPVVHPTEFDVAISYLIRRLEEGASQENFMSAVFDLGDNPALFERERQRFLASLAEIGSPAQPTNRVQDRTAPAEPAPRTGFRNEADTDPAIRVNREWGRAILERVATSELCNATVAAHTITDQAGLDAVFARTEAARGTWSTLSGAERAEILHRAGDALAARRADLIEVAAAEAGKTIDQADVEISEAIDFAHFYAELARELDDVDGAVFSPVGLTVVTPPWNFPVAIPAGSTLAALAAGSPVIMKPATQARRCGAVLAEALWEAGVPADALQFVQLGDRALGTALVADPRVERLILTGGYETAELFRSFRNDLPLLAETSGKNAIIVTPSADYDLAARDVAQSAFGHAGQKCSAASLVILVGSAATSRRFRTQLLDAVASLEVDYPTNISAQMGPMIAAPAGKLLSGLTTLGPGESWLIEPKQLDDSGKLWSPGVREGVTNGSEYHLTEYFGPILGIMTAETLDEAIEMQNRVDYGLTAGIHSLDRDELGTWLDRVQAGNLYVNRGITGAIVQRQPFGGWKKSAVGAGGKAGGPNYLVGLGHWASAPSAAKGTPSGAAAGILPATSGLSEFDRGYLARALTSDGACWKREFGTAKDVQGIEAERNVFRYFPVPVTVRLAEAGAVAPSADAASGVAQLVRAAAAGLTAGSPLTVSSAVELPADLAAVLARAGARVTVQDDAAFAAGLAGTREGRIRVIGQAAVPAIATALGGIPDVALYAEPVTESGRVEILPFLREQAVSVTAHRFGTPNRLTEGLL